MSSKHRNLLSVANNIPEILVQSKYSLYKLGVYY